MENIKKKFGFGFMRLPMQGEEVDIPETAKMVDAFLGAGFNYFDTSYVYHQGKSQEAVRKAVVERYPREGLLIATKFPTFILKPGDEDRIEGIFQSQLDDLGVEYVDYYLLHNLGDRTDRTARFVSCICCTFPNGDVLRARGTCEGSILFAPRGENGFGYDPLFLPDGYDCSMAELRPEEKNAISHRGNALKILKEELRNYYADK